MKNTTLHLLLLLILLNCNKRDSSSQKATEIYYDTVTIYDIKPMINENEESWIESFRNFREAVYQNNLSIVKNNLELPLQTDFGIITDENLKNNMNTLFPAEFIELFLKVKSQELLETNSFYLEINNSSIKLLKESNNLDVSFIYNNGDFDTEYGIFYKFNIINSKIKLYKVMYAG